MLVDFLRHDSGDRWRMARSSPTSVERGSSEPSVHRRPGYPLSGCVPAEPDSVSPGEKTITRKPAANQLNAG
jgi:hypothetical protein